MRRVTLGFWLAWLALLGPVRASAELVDGVAAIVDDEVILVSEVDLSSRRMIEAIEREQGRLPADAVLEIRRRALGSLIDDRLIHTVALRLNMETTEEEIDHAIQEIATAEDVSVEQVYGAAASQGLSRQRYRQELSKQMTRMKVISGAVRSRVSVSPAEVEALYNQRYGNLEPGIRVRLRHILLPWPEEATRDLANEIRERALASGDFPVLARTYSAAPSAQQGGLTTFMEADVSEEIRHHVFNLEPGAISPLIETEHGINIFQILDRFDPAETRNCARVITSKSSYPS
jgi:peptidyl-prolyl cis-trans isomerase SurA